MNFVLKEEYAIIKLDEFIKLIGLQSQLKQAKYKRLNSIFLAQYFRDENKKLQSQLKKEREKNKELMNLFDSGKVVFITKRDKEKFLTSNPK